MATMRGLRNWTAGKRRTHIVFFGTIVVLVFLAYSPVLLVPYGFSEDYRLLAEFRRGVVLSPRMIAEGRPLHAVWSALFLRPVGSISQLAIVRLTNLLAVSGIAITLALAWRRAGLRRIESIAAGVATVTLPSFQYMGSLATVGAHLWGAAAAGAAGLLTDRYWDPAAERPLRLRLLPALLLLVALTAYQPAGMLYWAYAAILLSARREPWPAYWRRLRGFVSNGAIAMASAFVIYELGKTIYASELAGAPRAAWANDVPAKLLWFLMRPVPHALNLWKLYPNLWFALGAMIAVAAGVAIHHRGLDRPVIRGVVLAGLVPFSYLPNLVVAENHSSFRSMIALSAVVFSIYVMLLDNQLRAATRRWLFRSAMIILAAVGVGWAIRNVLAYVVVPQSLELGIVRETVAGIDPADAAVLVIPSTWHDALAPAVLYDEFGYPSTALVWSSASLTWLVLMEQRHLTDTTAVRADTAGALPVAPDTVIDWSEVLRGARLRLEGRPASGDAGAPPDDTPSGGQP